MDEEISTIKGEDWNANKNIHIQKCFSKNKKKSIHTEQGWWSTLVWVLDWLEKGQTGRLHTTWTQPMCTFSSNNSLMSDSSVWASCFLKDKEKTAVDQDRIA